MQIWNSGRMLFCQVHDKFEPRSTYFRHLQVERKKQAAEVSHVNINTRYAHTRPRKPQSQIKIIFML